MRPAQARRLPYFLDTQAISPLAVPECDRAGVSAVSGVGSLQVLVPGHSAVVQHPASPGAHTLEVPAGKVSVVEPAAGKVVAVDLPVDPVRLHCELPSFFSLHAAAAIDNILNGNNVSRDSHFPPRGAAALGEPMM